METMSKEPVHTIEEFIELPIEEQAKYADPICKEYGNDEEFMENQFTVGFDDPLKFYLWNITSVANMAYLVIDGHPEYRERSKEILDKFIAWKRKEEKIANIIVWSFKILVLVAFIFVVVF